MAALLTGVALAHKNFWNPDSSSRARAYTLGSDPITSFYAGHLAPVQLDFYRVDLPQAAPVTFGLIAPQACPDIAPHL